MQKLYLMMILTLGLFLSLGVSYKTRAPQQVVDVVATARGQHTVSSRLKQIKPDAMKRLQPHLKQAGFDALPDHLLIVAFKEERKMYIYGAKQQNKWRLIRTYPIQGASGGPGPKLNEGDRQVPEGLYRIEGLNPNSAHRVSMKINYPSDEDWAQAKKDGRTQPGSNIFIHGGASSIGCLAIGDDPAEELFVMGAHVRAQRRRINVWIAPFDLRTKRIPTRLKKTAPTWARQRYIALKTALNTLPALMVE